MNPGYIYFCSPLVPGKYSNCIKIGQTENLERRLAEHGVVNYPLRIYFIGYIFGDRKKVERQVLEHVSRRIVPIANTTEYFKYDPSLIRNILSAIRVYFTAQDLVLYDAKHPIPYPTIAVRKGYAQLIDRPRSEPIDVLVAKRKITEISDSNAEMEWAYTR